MTFITQYLNLITAVSIGLLAALLVSFWLWQSAEREYAEHEKREALRRAREANERRQRRAA